MGLMVCREMSCVVSPAKDRKESLKRRAVSRMDMIAWLRAVV